LISVAIRFEQLPESLKKPRELLITPGDCQHPVTLMSALSAKAGGHSDFE
jgi:hypothetical protein